MIFNEAHSENERRGVHLSLRCKTNKRLQWNCWQSEENGGDPPRFQWKYNNPSNLWLNFMNRSLKLGSERSGCRGWTNLCWNQRDNATRSFRRKNNKIENIPKRSAIVWRWDKSFSRNTISQRRMIYAPSGDCHSATFCLATTSTQHLWISTADGAVGV